MSIETQWLHKPTNHHWSDICTKIKNSHHHYIPYEYVFPIQYWLCCLFFYNTFSKKDFLLNIPAEECVTDPLRKVQQHKVRLKNFKPYAKGGLGVSCLEKRSILIHSQSERERKNLYCLFFTSQHWTGSLKQFKIGVLIHVGRANWEFPWNNCSILPCHFLLSLLVMDALDRWWRIF